MPIIVEWGNEAHTIIHVRITGAYTWEEYQLATDRVLEMLTADVRGIINMVVQDTQSPPGNPISRYRLAAARILPRYDLIIVNLGLDGLEQKIMEIAERVIPHLNGRIFYASTIEEAYQLIMDR